MFDDLVLSSSALFTGPSGIALDPKAFKIIETEFSKMFIKTLLIVTFFDIVSVPLFLFSVDDRSPRWNISSNVRI